MPKTLDQVALFRHLPTLERKLTWVRLGDWPTPVEPLGRVAGCSVPIYVKREDLSNPLYGGNKVRTLEPMMGLATEAGASTIWATGAYGSNHATATTLLSPMAGLKAGVALFPQPSTGVARANLSAMLSARPAVQHIRHAVELPLVMVRLRRRDPLAYVMQPGGAIPRGSLGALSAALELAEQVEARACPAPAHIVLAVGSTCTTAGILAGLHLACALGIGFRTRAAIPTVTAVRVTPWPITGRFMILRLAYRTSRRLAKLTGAPAASLAGLHATLRVEGGFLGGGYGRPTADGLRAQHAFREAGGPPLDFVYSAKSGAALLSLAQRDTRGPLLFWATKSSAPLPRAQDQDLDHAPAPWRRFV
jgi:D-cysteine desulfhydrase